MKIFIESTHTFRLTLVYPPILAKRIQTKRSHNFNNTSIEILTHLIFYIFQIFRTVMKSTPCKASGCRSYNAMGSDSLQVLQRPFFCSLVIRSVVTRHSSKERQAVWLALKFARNSLDSYHYVCTKHRNSTLPRNPEAFIGSITLRV